jgi:hypothetical protein
LRRWVVLRSASWLETRTALRFRHNYAKGQWLCRAKNSMREKAY